MEGGPAPILQVQVQVVSGLDLGVRLGPDLEGPYLFDRLITEFMNMKNDLLFFCIHHHTFGHTIPSLPTDCHITNNELGAQMMCLCIIWAMRYVIIISFLFFFVFF